MGNRKCSSWRRTKKFEKRGVSAFVLVWNADNCIHDHKYAYVCPHACIRPFVMDEEEIKGFEGATREMKAPAAMKGMHFRMQVGVMDCLGCGNCVDVCPGNPKPGKALQILFYSLFGEFPKIFLHFLT